MMREREREGGRIHSSNNIGDRLPGVCLLYLLPCAVSWRVSLPPYVLIASALSHSTILASADSILVLSLLALALIIIESFSFPCLSFSLVVFSNTDWSARPTSTKLGSSI